MGDMAVSALDAFQLGADRAGQALQLAVLRLWVVNG
jgi:hypothetical protein